MTRVRTLTLVAAVLVLAVLAAFAWTAFGPAPQADAQTEIAASACCNPGVFTGTDTNGSFEGAIAAAVARAMACAGCCDRRIDYRVTQITGQVGGIGAQNDITVEIVASW
jgi:hypothetical protein